MRPLKHHSDETLAPAYASRSFARPIPKYDIPAEGLPAAVAHQLVRDEMNLDGNPVMNLASFVTTWMEPEADRLLADTANKNLIDQDEYPQTDEIHQRVISMQARACFTHAPKDAKPMGTATVGSSEAIMLGLLAHKWTWRKARQAAGKSIDRPNVVFGADVHTCWEKFALYFDVEAGGSYRSNNRTVTFSPPNAPRRTSTKTRSPSAACWAPPSRARSTKSALSTNCWPR